MRRNNHDGIGFLQKATQNRARFSEPGQEALEARGVIEQPIGFFPNERRVAHDPEEKAGDAIEGPAVAELEQIEHRDPRLRRARFQRFAKAAGRGVMAVAEARGENKDRARGLHEKGSLKGA